MDLDLLVLDLMVFYLHKFVGVFHIKILCIIEYISTTIYILVDTYLGLCG